MEWTEQHNYAIAFGAGLGLSNRQIAALMGITRNAVIGRRHRIGLYSDLPIRMVRKQAIKPPREKKLRSPAANKAPSWTNAETEILRANYHLNSNELAKLLPARSISAIQRHRLELSLYRINKFTPEDDATITADFNASVPIEEIAAKLNRTSGSIRQRIFHALKLHRDSRKTKLVKKFGVECLTISDDPNVIRQIFINEATKKLAADRLEYETKILAVLDAMDGALASGADRKTEFQAALAAGATLQGIGDRNGITRERVRQIAYSVKPKFFPRPPRNIECDRCGNDFLGNGNRRYCETCKPLHLADQYAATLAAHRANRERYKKGTRHKLIGKQRVKAALAQFSAADLREVLTDTLAKLDKNVP